MSEVRPVGYVARLCQCDPPALSDSVTTPRNNGGSLIGEMRPTRAAAVTSPLTARLPTSTLKFTARHLRIQRLGHC